MLTAAVSPDFNSIKVRLKLRQKTPKRQYVQLFQFHKGTIKTLYELCNQLTTALFQFHKGTIKTITHFFHILNYMNFNSIKVRLKHCLVVHNSISLIFQFHKGTIKTIDYVIIQSRNEVISIP